MQIVDDSGDMTIEAITAQHELQVALTPLYNSLKREGLDHSEIALLVKKAVGALKSADVSMGDPTGDIPDIMRMTINNSTVLPTTGGRVVFQDNTRKVDPNKYIRNLGSLKE